MSDCLRDDYKTGELSGLIFSGALSVQVVASIANHSLRMAKKAAPSGAAALEMKRMARLLDDAAASFRDAADLAYPRAVTMPAAE